MFLVGTLAIVTTAIPTGYIGGVGYSSGVGIGYSNGYGGYRGGYDNGVGIGFSIGGKLYLNERRRLKKKNFFFL